MAAAAATSVGSWIASSSSRRDKSYKAFTAQTSLSRGLFNRQQCHLSQLNHTKGKHGIPLETMRKWPNRQTHLFATTDNYYSDIDEVISDDPEQEQQYSDSEDSFLANNSPLQFEQTAGKAGFISFYGHRSKRETLQVSPNKNQSNLIWFIGPSVLVASFIFPSLYLRRILSSIFEDSLLTDFLILFFTEALFYCGVAAFLVLVDRTRRPLESVSPPTELLHRITSVATLVLSLIIPMVTMGLVWPWTGPAASATLAPYLVGIVMQFSFEQYAKYKKSSSWPVIPVVFQVYRLHQLNRAAQLVTALSFTVRGVEATPHNAAINSSLGTLLNVLQFLGVICIWSLASFLMRFFPSVTRQE